MTRKLLILSLCVLVAIPAAAQTGVDNPHLAVWAPGPDGVYQWVPVTGFRVTRAADGTVTAAVDDPGPSPTDPAVLSRLTTLEAMIPVLQSQIGSLEQAVVSLGERIEALEGSSLPPPPAAEDFSGAGPFELARGVLRQSERVYRNGVLLRSPEDYTIEERTLRVTDASDQDLVRIFYWPQPTVAQLTDCWRLGPVWHILNNPPGTPVPWGSLDPKGYAECMGELGIDTSAGLMASQR